MGLGVNEAYVPLTVTFAPTAGGVFKGAVNWKVKSAVFDCTASSETATWSAVSETAITVESGNWTDLPFIVSQTFAASSGLPLARMNSLSLIASVDRSGVLEITPVTMSAGEGAGLILKSAGGTRFVCTAAVTASTP